MNRQHHAVIVDAIRTPVGKYGGDLKDVRVDDMSALILRALVERTKLDPALVEDVFWGCANQAGEDNRNLARMALLLAGFPQSVPGTTINRLCGSSLESIIQGARAIWSGENDVVLAGGAENMTRAPFVFPKNVAGNALYGNLTAYDTALGWRFPNPKMLKLFPLESMGETAENVAEKNAIKRGDQDKFALESHRKAVAAREKFSEEIILIETPAHENTRIISYNELSTGISLSEQDTQLLKKFSERSQQKVVEAEQNEYKVSDGKVHRVVRYDEGPRENTLIEKLAKLKPAFREKGSVTAGNSSSLNDGAAGLAMMSEEKAKALGLKSLARILSTGVAGVDPRCMGIGPVPATQIALRKASLKTSEIGLIELNEAFAAQSLAVIRELDLDPAIVNVNGGAIALGHPLGCSGARIMTTLVHEMQRRDVRYGLAAMCIGVGQGIAVVVEKGK